MIDTKKPTLQEKLSGLEGLRSKAQIARDQDRDVEFKPEAVLAWASKMEDLIRNNHQLEKVCEDQCRRLTIANLQGKDPGAR